MTRFGVLVVLALCFTLPVGGGARAADLELPGPETAPAKAKPEKPKPHRERPVPSASDERGGAEPSRAPAATKMAAPPPAPPAVPEPAMVKVPDGKFEIGKFPVTFDEWDACVGDGGCNGYRPDDQGWGRGRRPVINVSWYDAQAYLEWLNRRTGKGYRLPTEAEWDYAARSGTKTDYWWGDEIGQNNANCNACGSQWDGKMTAPVGSFRPNPFGLYDMIGNVWQMCQDCYDSGCGERTVHGGSWDKKPTHLRVSYRGKTAPGYRTVNAGFRVARTVAP